MAENFFSGGQMPSDDLFLYFQRDLRLEDHWALTGTHYAATCEAWLTQIDANKAQALAIMERVYGAKQRLRRYVNWRLFFIACAELFAFRGGNEWMVSHYRFTKA
jgi:cyclopropane-fatty-acyl-phospholipid synthase